MTLQNRPLKVGLIGVGGIAVHHLKYLNKIAPDVGGIELVAGADVREEAVAKARAEHGVQHGYVGLDAYRQMLEAHPDLDAVDVCTPNAFHAEHAIAALEAGCHVMVEKPMARSVAEAESMLAAAKKAKRELMLGFQWRWHAESRYIRKQVEAGVLGDVKYCRVQALRRRGIPNWGTFGEKAKNGGGPMLDMGVHLLEMALYLMGTDIRKPVAASGQTWTYLGNQPDRTENIWPNWNHEVYDVEDLAVGHVRFANGASLVIEASFAAHIPQDTNDVQLFGTKGGAIWSRGEVYTDLNGFQTDLKPGFLRKTDIWDEKMKHFVQVSRGERENESSGEEGLAVQMILNGVYAAAEAGREIEL